MMAQEKPDFQDRQRRGLLAKIHIAKKDMGLRDEEYEAMLTAFKVETAAVMTVPQLENMVKLLKYHGWKPARRRKKISTADHLSALRRRCVEIAQEIVNGEKRLAGLAQSVCGVSSLTWCKETRKLERLLAILGKIKEEEDAGKERK